MRVDRDDRYVPEQSNNEPKTSFFISNIFSHYSKKKLIIMGGILAIIVLLLSSLIFRSSKPKTPTPLTPPEVSGVSTTEESKPAITEQPNDFANNSTQAQASNTMPTPAEPAPITDVNGQQNSNELTGNNYSEQNTQGLPDSKHESQVGYNTSQQGNNSSHNNMNNRPSSPNNVESKPNKPDIKSNNNAKVINNSTKVNKIKNNQFSVQLSASTSVEGLKKFAKKHNLTNYEIYQTNRNGVKWFILIEGTYDSADEARKAIKSLPNALQKDKPWVKSGATINKEKSAK